MSIGAAFTPQSATFNITTNATPATASAQLVSFNPVLAAQVAAQASGLGFCPQCVRVVNTGTVPVWISFTTALRTAIIAVAGTPSLEEVPVLAGAIEVFALSQVANVASATPYTLQVNTIASVASQVLYVTFGEGL